MQPDVPPEPAHACSPPVPKHGDRDHAPSRRPRNAAAVLVAVVGLLALAGLPTDVQGVEGAGRPRTSAPAAAVRRPSSGSPLAHAIAAARIPELIRDEMREKRIPGAAVCIAMGTETYVHAFGEADAQAHRPVTTSTLFNLASVSKLMTALLLTQLDADGTAPLEAPIGSYFAGLHPRLAAVTAAELLSHTAGLAENPSTPEAVPAGEDWPVQLAQRLDPRCLVWPPGELFSYSSAGYAVAAGAAAQRCGSTFAELLRRRVCGPLGMERTAVHVEVPDQGDVAAGYCGADAHGEPARCPPPPYPGTLMFMGAGRVYASIDDLGRLAVALASQGAAADGTQRLPAAVVRLLMTPQHAIEHSEYGESYGYGLYIRTMEGGTLVYHGGGDIGCSALIEIVPERNYAWVSVTNQDYASLDGAAWVALDKLARVRDLDRPQPVPCTADSQPAAAVTGRYYNGPDDYHEIFVSGGGLWLSHPAFGHVVPLTCIGRGLYRYEPGESRAQFLLAVLSPGRAISAGECVYVAASYDPWADAARNTEGGQLTATLGLGRRPGPRPARPRSRLNAALLPPRSPTGAPGSVGSAAAGARHAGGAVAGRRSWP